MKKNTARGFILPSLAVIASLQIIPLMYSVNLSLQGGRANNLHYVGLQNFWRALSDKVFLRAFGNVFLYGVVLVPGVLLLSFFIAYAVNTLHAASLKGFIMTILFIPSITSPVAYSFFFRRLFQVDGFFNGLLIKAGFVNAPIHFMATGVGARIVILTVCFWAWTGYYAVMVLASLQSMEKGVYEAAKMDGAGEIRIIFRIMLPILKPILTLSAVLLSNSVIQLFSEIAIITKGGPSYETITPTYYIYRLSFEYIPQFGYAASVGVYVFLFSAVIGLMIFKLGEWNEDD